MRLQRAATWCALLSLVGLGLSGYLTFLHLGLLRGELLGGPVCGGSGGLNCLAVTSGSWGAFLGIPLSLWGVLGYLLVFALALLGSQSEEWGRDALTLTFALALLCVSLDLILLTIMVAVIRLYCLFCLLTYAVNLLLLLVSGWAVGRPWSHAVGQAGASLQTLLPASRRPGAVLFWGMAFMAVLGTFGVHASTAFVSRGAFGSIRKQIREYVARQPRVAVDVVGDPAFGPANAPIQLVEFSDFFCPACQRASKMNEIILANHRQDVLLVFKNYPLDTSCNEKVSRMVHAGACRVAAAGECAHLQGKFWAFHDLVFEKGSKYSAVNVDADAAQLGLDMAGFRACMDSGQGLEAVKRDIAEGSRVGVSSTPTYVINGLPVAGGVQPFMFDDFTAVLRESGR